MSTTRAHICTIISKRRARECMHEDAYNKKHIAGPIPNDVGRMKYVTHGDVVANV